MTKALVIATMIFMAPVVVLKMEVDAQAPITQRILFLVDRSGSMQGDHFTRALTAFKQIAETPIDDLQIGVIAFNDEVIRWPGRPEEGVPPGWARLPSSAAEAAQNWLSALGAGGDTLVAPALTAALEERRPNLSIILVSDGLLGRERTDDIMRLIRVKQLDREEANLGKAVIGVYGLGPCQKILCSIAEMGHGAYIREEVQYDEDPPPPAALHPPR